MNSPRISSGTSMISTGQGTPCGAKALKKPTNPVRYIPPKIIRSNVIEARAPVTLTFAVAAAKQGTRPNRFMVRMKKK